MNPSTENERALPRLRARAAPPQEQRRFVAALTPSWPGRRSFSERPEPASLSAKDALRRPFRSSPFQGGSPALLGRRGLRNLSGLGKTEQTSTYERDPVCEIGGETARV